VKFPWASWGDGIVRPLLRCELRRHGKIAPADFLILVDTGADTTTLPLQLASLIGFSTGELESVPFNGVGGQTTCLRPKAGPDTDIKVGGHWFALPGLVFGDKTPALLGRDLIFKDFKLRMETGETELLPLKPR
jgi:hypothetical protein